MVAILEIGAFSACDLKLAQADRTTVTSLMAGTLGDLIGRRRTLLLGAIIFVCGGAIQSLSTGFPMMVRRAQTRSGSHRRSSAVSSQASVSASCR